MLFYSKFKDLFEILVKQILNCFPKNSLKLVQIFLFDNQNIHCVYIGNFFAPIGSI